MGLVFLVRRHLLFVFLIRYAVLDLKLVITECMLGRFFKDPSENDFFIFVRLLQLNFGDFLLLLLLTVTAAVSLFQRNDTASYLLGLSFQES